MCQFLFCQKNNAGTLTHNTGVRHAISIEKTAHTVNGRSGNPSHPFTTYQHMRPLSREKPVSIYSCHLGHFGAATREGYSIYPTRTASQLPRLSVTFGIYVLSPSMSFFVEFIIVVQKSVVKEILRKSKNVKNVCDSLEFDSLSTKKVPEPALRAACGTFSDFTAAHYAACFWSISKYIWQKMKPAST